MSLAPVAEDVRGSLRPRGPYVGLVPYDEADAAFFFGRSTEAAIVAANLRASRLTILYGPSGVGKSSLLMAGAVHELHEDAAAAAESPFAVCVFRSWRDDPVPGVREAAQAALQELAGSDPLPPPAGTLSESLRAWTGRTGTLLLVFDQFEEYFQYHPDEGDDDRLTGFAAELARIVNDPSLPVNVLVSIREDAWAKLDRFEAHVPALFSNYVRVDHLDLEAAREAIEGPIEAWNRSLPEGEQPFEIEPALVEAVLAATAGGSLTLTAGIELPNVEAPDDRIEAPFLQLVLERLWRDTVADGEHTLTLARLEALGGAHRIVENHLLDALGRLTPAEQDTASDCFRFLVSTGKTKIAHSAADLAEWTQRPEDNITAVLDKLCSRESGLILRTVPAAEEGGSKSYELFHDILAEPILAWRRNHEQERSRQAARRRRVRIGGAVLLLGLLPVFVGLTIWALVKSRDASRASAAATSLALSFPASEQLASHLDVSLLLSLAAYRTSPTAGARRSMISALEEARIHGVQAILHGVRGSASGVAFSRDGKTLAVAGGDGKVRLWDVRGQTEFGDPLAGPEGTSVNGVAFSPDGRTLAAATNDGKVRLWNLRTRTALLDWSAKSPSVSGVAFSPDGRTLATAGSDGTVRLWDVRRQIQLGGPLAGPATSVNGVAFSPDGRTLAAASNDGKVRLWNLRTRTALLDWSAKSPSVSGVAFSPNGRILATAGSDGTVRRWDISKQTQLGEPLVGPKGTSVNGVAFSPDGRRLAAAFRDGTVRLWDARTPTKFGLAGPKGTSVSGLAFSPKGSRLAVAGSDGTVWLWQVGTQTHGQPLAGAKGTSVSGVAFSPNGSRLAVAGSDGKVWLWDVGTQTHGQPLAGAKGISVSGVAFSPNGSRLAVAGSDGKVWLWDVGRQTPVRRLAGPEGTSVNGVAFSPDGHTLAAASNDGKLRLWDVRKRTSSPNWTAESASVSGIVFSPDGRTLAVAGGGNVRLWNMGARREFGHLDGPKATFVSGVAFSPDGRMLAVANTDGKVRLWDVRTQTAVGQPLRGANDVVNGVAVSSDGTLASGSGSTVSLWGGVLWKDLGALKKEVCGLVWGTLSPKEWHEFAPDLAYHASCE